MSADRHQQLMRDYPSYRRNCDENGNFVLDKFRRQIYSESCSLCQHLTNCGLRMCDVFPEEYGIPDEIWSGKNRHTSAYPGDRGVQFARFHPPAKERA
ncbi:MAG: hypothetical protein FD134_2395 [Gallionellaceae bacterium]|nr:MAG: hypothetical protein FD134_2395 [Gallionellaceae bacterium]